jgi:cell pole-organizing protein PopZ
VYRTQSRWQEGAESMAHSTEARAFDMRTGAAPAPAAREPSMEEILASIKRIIEDTDGIRRPAASPAPVEIDDDEETIEAVRPDAANDMQVGDAGAEVMVFRDEFREKPAAVQQPAPFVPPLPRETAHREAVTHEPVHREPAHHRAEEPAANAAPRPAIISELPGRQVAAAFGELNEAFAASRKRSFDEIAEDMMRPMLQDWLDNNLPLLVERLVREEIERVARGGSR